MTQPTVIVVVDDLFFLAKIQTTLKHLGLAAQVLTQRAAAQTSVQDATAPLLALVDLTLRADDAVAVITSLRAAASTVPLTVLAFGPHVAADIRQQALAAGADRVVTKSTFSQHLAELIQAEMASS